jgi:hypothetical protein
VDDMGDAGQALLRSGRSRPCVSEMTPIFTCSNALAWPA